MALEALVAEVFGPNGALARAVDSYKPRAGQVQMASAIAQTIATGGSLVVEAGTGIGKTFAYLVPVLLSGERVLLSTATKALQDQLFARDIPRLLEALRIPVRVALLKGRSSYLCLHRLGFARDVAGIADFQTVKDLAMVEVWSHVTRSGDLAEIQSLAEDSAALPLVSSTKDNCLGAQCPKANVCHVNSARKQAMEADIVVVNHHLFFADSNVRDSGVAELLPSVRTVVFDEAHQLNDIGIQFTGTRLTSNQLIAFSRDLALHGNLVARGLANWSLFALDINRQVDALRALCKPKGGLQRRPWGAHGPQGIAVDKWSLLVQGLKDLFAQVLAALQSGSDVALEMRILVERAERIVDLLKLFSQPFGANAVRWLETGVHVRMHQTPLSIRAFMAEKLGANSDQASLGKSWVFTSATLGADPAMASFVDACGLDAARLLKVQSPFDYQRQAVVYVPPDLPKPSEPTHSLAVAQFVAQSAELVGGRTLVLTTTLKAMHSIASALAAYFGANAAIEVLVQGQAPKQELLKRFSHQGLQQDVGYVLVASMSFWEGVDVVGDALTLLVIDKLPFAPPDDPLVQAQGDHLASIGKNAFSHLHLPSAIMALKQGAGRLIRSETDHGALAICDTRLITMGYGKKILAALPPMRLLHTQEEFDEALNAITKPSTMGLC